MSDTVGLTKDAGWELGVRQTVSAPLTVVWTYLLGPGLHVWLGDIDALPIEKGATYLTRDGVAGDIRSYSENAKLRLTWRPDDWPHDSTLQLTVREAATGTTIGIHHEQLADRSERKMMLGHWKNVMAAMADELA